MTTCTRRLEFDAAHRVLRHESKCAHLHGHRYAIEVTCDADKLDDVGRVVDFGEIKAKLGAWIDAHLDHGTLVNGEDDDLLGWLIEHDQKRRIFLGPDDRGIEPTAENIADLILRIGQQLLERDGLRVVQVRVWETPNCSAEVWG